MKWICSDCQRIQTDDRLTTCQRFEDEQWIEDYKACWCCKSENIDPITMEEELLCTQYERSRNPHVKIRHAWLGFDLYGFKCCYEDDEGGRNWSYLNTHIRMVAIEKMVHDLKLLSVR